MEDSVALVCLGSHWSEVPPPARLWGPEGAQGPGREFGLAAHGPPQLGYEEHWGRSSLNPLCSEPAGVGIC